MFNIRVYKIDFTSKENILPTDGSILGYQGENNATTLSIIPPEEMTACEDIVAYKVAFELNNCRHTRSETIAKTSPVEVLLSSLITSSKEISVQLEGYGADGNLVVKSPKVTKLTFDDSVGGVSVDKESENAAAAEIAANTVARHTHENADILNELAENESGNLTYKGEKIGGGERATETAEFLFDYSYEANMDISSFTNNALVIKAIKDESKDYANKEIAKIEFSFDSGESWIDVRDFIQSKVFAPYVININRSFEYYDGEYDTVCFGVLGFYGNTDNYYIQQIELGNQHGFRVTYYTD